MKVHHRWILLALSSFLLVSLYAESPARHSTVVDKRDPNDENSQLFIGSADGREEAYLCHYVRSAGVVFSGERSWLAVNEHTASSGGDEIRIFKWIRGLQYSEVEGRTALSELCYEDARKTLGFTEYPEDFGCNCVGWSEHGAPRCLIEIRVTQNGKDYVLKRSFAVETGRLEPVVGE